MFINGLPCAEYTLPNGIVDSEPNTLSCIIPVSDGDELKIRGYFEGTILHGSVDLLADGSFLADKRIEGSKSGEVKAVKRKLDFDRVFDMPVPPGHTSIYPSTLVVEGVLTACRLQETPTVADGVDDGVGSLSIVISISEHASDNYETDYSDLTCGSWKTRDIDGVTDGGLPPTHELGVHVTDPNVNPSRQSKHRRHGAQTRFGSKPWAKFIFYYRSRTAIEMARCVYRQDKSYELEEAGAQIGTRGGKEVPTGCGSQTNDGGGMFVTPPPPGLTKKQKLFGQFLGNGATPRQAGGLMIGDGSNQHGSHGYSPGRIMPAPLGPPASANFPTFDESIAAPFSPNDPIFSLVDSPYDPNMLDNMLLEYSLEEAGGLSYGAYPADRPPHVTSTARDHQNGMRMGFALPSAGQRDQTHVESSYLPMTQQQQSTGTLRSLNSPPIRREGFSSTVFAFPGHQPGQPAVKVEPFSPTANRRDDVVAGTTSGRGHPQAIEGRIAAVPSMSVSGAADQQPTHLSTTQRGGNPIVGVSPSTAFTPGSHTQKRSYVASESRESTPGSIKRQRVNDRAAALRVQLEEKRKRNAEARRALEEKKRLREEAEKKVQEREMEENAELERMIAEEDKEFEELEREKKDEEDALQEATED